MKSTFDPFTATFEEARLPPGFGVKRPKDTLSQWMAAQELMNRRQFYETEAVMQGVALCLREGLTAPAWLEAAFVSRCAAGVEANSWDHAFGTPYPTRTQVALLRKRERLQWELLGYFLQEGVPRTPAGYRKAAQVFGITAAQAREWTPKMRRNTRGHKPYTAEKQHPAAHDPFGLTYASRKSG